MLDPDIVLSTIITAFSSIPEVVSELGGLVDQDNVPTIIGHTYAYGSENSLIKSVYEMRNPSILVAYLDLLGGNFDGETLFKHRLEVYLRAKNSAPAMQNNSSPIPFLPIPATPPHLWWMLMNVNMSTHPDNSLRTQRVRYGRIHASLLPPDTPTLMHRQDETGADFFVGNLVFPELGDDY